MNLIRSALYFVVAVLLGFLAYRRGIDDGRARGCSKGIALENNRVHDGWCRLLSERGVSDDVLGTRCQAPREGMVATESLDACLSD